MMFEYTEQEKQQLIAIDETIAAKLDKLDEIILSSNKDSAEYQEATREATRLEDERQQAFAELYKQAELKHFKAISGSTDSIIKNAKEQTEAIINNLYQTMLELYGRLKGDEKSPSGSLVIPIQNIIENEKTSLSADVEQGGIILSATQTLAMIRSGLHLHFKALKNDKEALAVINDYIITTVTNSPYIAKYDATAPPKEDLKANNLLEIPKTKFPNEFIIPKDKISNMLFNGQLSEELQPLRMERSGSRKELTALVSINFDELKEVQLSNKYITPYDRGVYEAVVSLYIDGENEYVTPLMIYRTMTAQPKGKLTEKILNDISEAIERCSRTRVYIDATGEVEGKGYDIQQPIYKENLLYTRSIKGLHNGNMGEWIQIIQPPILYRYANSKNQVARMDMKLLNTPVNKNEETIVLQGYLQRRVLTMKGSNLSKNILYETIYKQLNIEATSTGALRKKQSKIRDTTKIILEYWKEENFILDYKENPGPNKSKTSISIIL